MDAMPGRPLLLALGILSIIGGGCRTPHQPPAAAASLQQQTRVNSYSLLHQLLTQQRNVDKLLVIKLESAELKRLIKSIAAASGAGADQLEEFARQDRSLRLDQTSLPPGESATRDAIARTKKKELLTPFNSNFELDLLLTQSEALSYAWHLGKVAALNEPDAGRARLLNELSSEMKGLHGQVFALMRSHLVNAK